MNVQITSLSETEPKEKENRKQSIKRWGGTHTQVHKANAINVTEIGLQQNSIRFLQALIFIFSVYAQFELFLGFDL